MKVIVNLFLASLILLSCKGNNARSDAGDNITSEPNQTAKTLGEIKLALLDSRYEKAELLLNKPDVRGRIMDGLFYYTVYYNKVVEEGKKKHLVLFVNGKGGINDRSTIYKIVAVENGETILRAGNFAQWLKVSEGNLESNAMGFSVGKGDKTWLDVDYSTGSVVSSKNNTIGDTKFVNGISELPDPKKALKDTTVKKYKVMNCTAIEIFDWYAAHFKAKRIDGSNDSFSMPYYSDHDSCVHVTMTGLLDGIRIEFSYECDGQP